MTRALWRIAAVTLTDSAADLSGTGAKTIGGRFNSKGVAMVYCSDSIALAVLKTLVHLRPAGLPLSRYLVHIEVPDCVPSCRYPLAVFFWYAPPR